MLVQFLYGAGADAAGIDQLLDASIADAYQGKFSRHKEGVGGDQQQDNEYPQQQLGKHSPADFNTRERSVWALALRARRRSERVDYLLTFAAVANLSSRPKGGRQKLQIIGNFHTAGRV